MNTIPSVLALDIGNTSIHLAIVHGEDVTDPKRFDVASPAGLAEELDALWTQMDEPRRIVASSVNPDALTRIAKVVLDALSEDLLVVGRDLPLPIATDLDSPESVGTDRLCAAVAAYDRLGASCVVADFGSAATIDCVNDDGVFLGGVILPGIGMSLASLAEHTALLPALDAADPEGPLGKTTPDAIQLGVLSAARGALRDRTEAYAELLGHWPLVVCTGGDAARVAGQIDLSDLVQAVVPDLTLRGVAMAYYNAIAQDQDEDDD
jgi:type III pantothenate kinase